METWPTTLPTPLIERTHWLVPRNEHTLMDSQRSRVRRSFVELIELLDVTWHFTEDQFQSFETFVQITLEGGTLTFEMVSLEESEESDGFNEVTRTLAFFEEPYTFSRSDNLYSVTATLELVVPVEVTALADPGIPIDSNGAVDGIGSDTLCTHIIGDPSSEDDGEEEGCGPLFDLEGEIVLGESELPDSDFDEGIGGGDPHVDIGPRCGFSGDVLGPERPRGEYPNEDAIWFTSTTLAYCRWTGTAPDGRFIELRRYTGENRWTFTKYLLNSAHSRNTICTDDDPEGGPAIGCQPSCFGTTTVDYHCGCDRRVSCLEGCEGCILCSSLGIYGAVDGEVFGEGPCEALWGTLPEGCVEGNIPCVTVAWATKRSQTDYNKWVINREFAYLNDDLDGEGNPIPRLTPNGVYNSGASFEVTDCCDHTNEYWTFTPITVTVEVPPP